MKKTILLLLILSLGCTKDVEGMKIRNAFVRQANQSLKLINSNVTLKVEGKNLDVLVHEFQNADEGEANGIFSDSKLIDICKKKKFRKIIVRDSKGHYWEKSLVD